MATNSLELNREKTAQYVSLRRDSIDRDNRAVIGYREELRAKKAALIARLSHILDAATLESMGIAELEALLNEQPSVKYAELVKRMDPIVSVLEKVCPASDEATVEITEPVVELDPQEVAAFRVMCERFYSDGESSFPMSDASPEDFDEWTGEYIYKQSVN